MLVDGKFMSNIWAESKNAQDKDDKSKDDKGKDLRSRNAFAALAEEGEDDTVKPNNGFHWRGVIF